MNAVNTKIIQDGVKINQSTNKSMVHCFASFFNSKKKWPCRLGLQNTPTASLPRSKLPISTSVLDMTSDAEAPVMLELLRIQSTPSLPLLPGPLWSGVIPLDWVLSMGQIELFNI